MKKIVFLLVLFTMVSHAQVVNIPDANFKTKLLENGIAKDLNNNSILIDTNGNGEIEVSEAAQVGNLNMDSSLIYDATGIEYFVNLVVLSCSGTQITSLNLGGLSNLRFLSCQNNRELISLNLNGLTNLNQLYCNNNKLASLDLSGFNFLNWVRCNNNSQLTTLNISNLPNLTYLECKYNQITSLNATGLSNLRELDCSFNAINSLLVAGLTNLQSLTCYSNQLTQLEVNTLNNLMYLNCEHNNLTSLTVNNLTNLRSLIFRQNQIDTIDISSLSNLNTFNCSGNQISFLDVNMLTNLTSLILASTPITELNISNLVNLTTLEISFTQIASIDLSHLINLQSFTCANTPITNLDLSNQSQLRTLTCNYTQISSLDISHLSLLNFLGFGGDQLTIVNMKNGNNETPNFFTSPNLQFVCTDESELSFMQNRINQSGNTNTVISSYCSFTPGGDYNTISGNIQFDLANDGCDTSDFPHEYLKVNINDTSQTGSTFTNNSGDYRFYTQAGNFTITPEVENPSYFNFSPLNATLNFPLVDNSVQTQDFCVTANGIHPDLEVTFVPIGNARPGFNAQYKLVFKNKGNEILSGNITLNYDSNKLDFISTFPDDNFELNVNQILWNYSYLLPFETRTIDLVLQVIAPPTVNNGDILNFTTSINPTGADETPLDNTFVYDQTVVNSYDPNQIQCLEGNTITLEDVGKYLHYNIDFENIGTADAVNVVVKSTIDTEKYNLNSLQLQYASHEVETKVTGNIVEFIFKNIHLQPWTGGPIGGHGNVLFKIKTQPDLVIGDEVMGSASIFFDYNAPIDTNEARTEIASLSNSNFTEDRSIQIAPNPVKDKLTISAQGIIKSIQLFDAQGRILQTVLESKKTSIIDISDKASGAYFIKVTTEAGVSVEKIMKEN